MKKIRNDLVLALFTFACFMSAILITMPVWLFAVIITLGVVGAVFTVVTIVNMRKASLDEATGSYSYRFPVWDFVIGAVLLTALTVVIMLVSIRLYGFALIPLAVLILALCVIAYLKSWKIAFIETAVVLAILAVFLISYGASYLAYNDVNLNPGIDASTPAEDESQNPNDETKKPGDETEKPSDETEKTGDETTPPAVTVKIDAPETLSYGKPVTVKLEGCHADDLVYGNEDFISITKISDTEVSIILVGIVNEATGEVEIVPASGYITITDKVSGTNVSINIVE